MAFFNSAVGVLQTLVIALGAGLGIWGVVNLMEGYGNDNPGAKYQELKRFECLPGDILMSCSGTMGELYQLPDGCEKGVINQALCKFTLNERILPICFLVYMKQTIGNLETKGSGIQNIAAVSYVKQMPINLPPMDVQNEFEQFVHQVDKSNVVDIKAA